MAKKKKAMWPIWLTGLLSIGIIALMLIDWERYPTGEELGRFLKSQDSDVERVEMIKIEKVSGKHIQDAQVYHFISHKKDGSKEENSYPVKKKDRKPVKPWHYYYADREALNRL